ncbi:Hypothetical protein D9617_7g030170 [Elsinoe fawcettii]|nr:Hypothetical protein D9617_7g030170 [Elsinoe fawcettii]
MVVRALRRLGVERCRVNERHDIVLDLGTERTGVDTEGRNGREEDTHTTPWTGGETRKVSGSAYKLTRGRALHHGTALLGSGNLGRIKEVLTAVGRGVIESKGVESVSSTVANVEVENEAFVEEVRSEFANMYERVEGIEVDETWLEDEGLRKGWEELKSLDWTYCQTPRFKIRNDSFATGDGRGLPSLVMEAKGGFVDTVEVKKPDQVQGFAMDLKDKSEKFKIHELRDWTRVLSMWEATSATELDSSHKSRLASWLRDMLPSGA